MTLLGCLEYPDIIGYDTHAPVIPVSHGTRESGAGKVSSHKRRRTRCCSVGGGVFGSQPIGRRFDPHRADFGILTQEARLALDDKDVKSLFVVLAQS